MTGSFGAGIDDALPVKYDFSPVEEPIRDVIISSSPVENLALCGYSNLDRRSS